MSAAEFQRQYGSGAKGKPSNPAIRTKLDGHSFASKMEARRYEWLKAHPDVLHIDRHPVFTLSTGRRWQADFACYYADELIVVEDVKGHVGNKFDSWRRFVLIREDFDAHHPLRPLRVITFNGSLKVWEDV
jgi:hypothetical protein